jgi:catechol 2,3-dioxygenase-like lactoylglutathione lyase family enzyme
VVRQTLPAVVPGPAQVSAEALTSRIRQISSLPVNHAGMRIEDMDAAIAWYRAVLGFDLIDEARPGVGQAASAPPSPKGRGLTGLLGGVIGGGEEPTGRGFIGGGNQHASTLDLHLRVLSSGIISRRVR